MKKKLIVIGGAAAVVVVIAVIAVLGNLGAIVKEGVERVGPVVLKAPVTLERARISAFSGSGKLKGMTIGNPETFNTSHAFKMESLKIKLDPKSIASDKIHVKEVIIDSPNIIFEGGFGASNLGTLHKNVTEFAENLTGGEGEEETTDSQGGESKKIQIDYLKVSGGSISVSMRVLRGKKLTVPMPTLELRDIGKEKDTTVAEAVGEILGAVNTSVVGAVKKAVGKVTEGAKKVGTAAKGGVEKGVGKVKGIFGK